MESNIRTIPGEGQPGGGTEIRVALYARASSDAQEHSTPGQFRDLRKHPDLCGFEVVAEIADEGEKRHTLDRPGIEKLRELAAAGAVDEVWAWAWDRYGQYPTPDVLALEMEDYGVKLRALDDGGGGEASFEMNVIRSLFSRREQRSRVDRSRRGREDKSRRGQIFGGFRARYGFEFVKNERGKNVAYAVNEEQMQHVRRMFEMLAAGESLHAVQRALEQGRIPNPSGGPRWSRTTLRNAVTDDVYRPLSHEEVAAMVTPEVVATLEPERVYGISWAGRKRSKFKSSRSKSRTVFETSPEEWTAIPVDLTGSGLDRTIVDCARAVVGRNKAPSKVGDRYWELSGVLRCGECGRAMHAYRRSKKEGCRYYYRCRPDSTVDKCPNRKSHPAEDLETRAWLIVYETATDPEGALVQSLTEYYEERRKSLGSGGAARRAALVEALAKIESKRRNFWEMAAEGDIPREHMRERVAALDEEKSGIETELEATEDAVGEIEALDGWYESLKQTLQWEDWDIEFGLDLGENEERHKLYKRMGINFTADENGTLEAGWQIRNSLQTERTCC